MTNLSRGFRRWDTSIFLGLATLLDGRLDCLLVFKISKVISHNAALSACEKGTGAIGVCGHAQERDENQM